MACPRNSPFFSELGLESGKPGGWKLQSEQRSQTVYLHCCAETQGLADGPGSCWTDDSKAGHMEAAAQGCWADGPKFSKQEEYQQI